MPDEILITFGGEIKALGAGRFAGPLVTFTDPSRPDLAGDWFDTKTDFAVDFPARSPLYYAHGLDTKMGKRRIGTGEMTLTDAGIWLEGQLSLRDEYEEKIYSLVEASKAGLSSGTAGHLVERTKTGKSFHIDHWPLGLDASLTPTPCEFSHCVMPLKSFLLDGTRDQDAEDEDEVQAALKAVSALSLPSHSTVTVSLLNEFCDRVRANADIRAKDGRVLSEANLTRVDTVLSHIETARQHLLTLRETVRKPKDSPSDYDQRMMKQLLLDRLADEARLLGVAL